MHQNGEGRKTKAGEKNFSAPVSQKERGESRSWIPEKFRSTYNKLQCTCQNGMTTLRSCHVYQKKVAFMHTPSLPAFYSTQSLHLVAQHWTPKTVHTVSNVHQNIAIKGAILCPSKCTKMHIIASDFSKNFPGGACPRTPLAGLGLRPSFCRLYAS